MLRIYYAHSLSIYDTQQEIRDIDTLEGLGFYVVNPNSREVQEGVNKWKQENGDDATMKYFDNILDTCDAIAFRPHPDGKIGSGVWYEVQYIREQRKPVVELPNLFSYRVLSKEDTREYLRVSGQR